MNIAIIPARHGSKSILNKNLQKVGNKSLVHRAIQSAIDSKIFQNIILTTDIPVLVEEFEDSKVVAVRHRPKNLCADDTIMSDVVLDAMDAFGIWPEMRVWLLQPTAPFREQVDYQRILQIFKTTDTKSVISMFDVGACHPNRMYTIDNQEHLIYPLRHTSFSNKQELLQVFQRSGHYYVFYAKEFREQNSFFIKPCKGYFIERVRAMVNIDEPLDLAIAKLFEKEGLCR